MWTARLLDIYDKPEEFIAQMNGAGLAGVSFEANDIVKGGIRARTSACASAGGRSEL
jgi:hypothetical protein